MNKKRKALIWFIGLILITTSMASSAWAEKAQFLGEDVEIMPLKDVKPGMIGYGESVFKGYGKERFEVKIESINFLIKDQYIIWAKAWGGPDDILNRAGVIAGMSGSPIYLQDPEDGQYKLIGALAYGYDFQPPNEALAGIQPVEGMLKLQELLTAYYARTNTGSIPEKFRSLPNPDKIKIPLLLTGSEKAIEFFKRETKKYLPFEFFEQKNIGLNSGFPIRTETNAGQIYLGSNTLEAGDAISAVLSWGDLPFAATGTVTLANSKGFLAFGHPFLWTGFSNIPIFQAEIGMIVPSLATSFKEKKQIVAPQLGTIVIDSFEGILGVWHSQSTMLPLKINFTKYYPNGFKKEEQWNIEMARKNPFSNLVLVLGILYPIEFGSPNLTYLSFDVKTDFIYEENGMEQELSLSKSFFSKEGNNILSNIMYLGNIYVVFEKARKDLKEIKVDIQVTQEHEGSETPVLRLVNIEPEKTLLKPKEEISLGLMLKDEKKDYSKTINIQAPDFQGKIKIRIQDRSSRLKYLVFEALDDLSRIEKVFEFIETSADKDNVFYIEVQHIKSIAEREGTDNKGWKETIRETEELSNTEIREIEVPEIQGRVDIHISSQKTLSVTSKNRENDIKQVAEGIVGEIRNTNDIKKAIKFKPELFVSPPLCGIFSDIKGNLKINTIGVDVGLLEYKRLKMLNFGLGINLETNNPKLSFYGKFAPVKINIWKKLFAEANVGIDTNGKFLVGLSLSFKL